MLANINHNEVNIDEFLDQPIHTGAHGRPKTAQQTLKTNYSKLDPTSIGILKKSQQRLVGTALQTEERSRYENNSQLYGCGDLNSSKQLQNLTTILKYKK